MTSQRICQRTRSQWAGMVRLVRGELVAFALEQTLSNWLRALAGWPYS